MAKVTEIRNEYMLLIRLVLHMQGFFSLDIILLTHKESYKRRGCCDILLIKYAKKVAQMDALTNVCQFQEKIYIPLAYL